MREINVTGLIPDSVRTQNIWEKEDYHCPSCGKETIFSGGDDDYYFGQVHLCLSCNAAFFLPLSVREANDRELVYIKVLKEKLKEIE